MARWVLGILACGLWTACGASTAAVAPVDPPAARPVRSPTEEAADRAAVQTFCARHDTETYAKPFPWPALADGAAAPGPGRWRWVIGWATWCGPCLKEMPLIEKWKGALAAEGVGVDVTYVSVDEEPRKLAAFADRHPELDLHLRLSEGALARWFDRFELDASTRIPLHFMVDPQGRTRCLRSGSVGEDDFWAVRRILQGG